MIDKINRFKEYVNKYELGYLLNNVSFKCMTSIRIGGTSELLYIPSCLDDLLLSMKFIKEQEINYFIIGAGTNLLINDRHFEMVTISLKKLNKYRILEVKDNATYVYVEAGVKASEIAKYVSNNNISGAEFMSVIPGTVGGLTYMNAGAYKKSMSDIIESITYINEDGDICTIQRENINFNYRHSMFKDHNYIIISVILQLNAPGKYDEIPENKIKRYLQKKKESQPINCINAGSVFKNKNNNLSWEIIDYLGYRGYICGDAKVSEKHANFIVNLGNATYEEIITIINSIKKEAKDKLNIEMECEWEIIE